MLSYSLIYPQQVTLYQTDDQIYSPLEVADVNTFNTFFDALDGSYCTYSAYGETGDDPNIDPIYPDPAPGGYKGKLQCGIYKPTNVISASYGEAESDLPINYSKRQCNEFMKLALQGHSILIASGDYGVASAPGDSSASGCLGPTGKIFNPQYPSNCPYVTSVGGTQLYADQTVLDAESVMQTNLGGSAANFSSSGGFSNYYPQPDYQKEAVARYFATAHLKYPYYSEFQVDVNTTAGLYNRIGRGYPDVASNGAFMTAVVNGQLDPSDWFGTSLAAPTFASMLTLVILHYSSSQLDKGVPVNIEKYRSMKSALQSRKDLLALSTLFFMQTRGSSMISRTELILAVIRMASKLFLGMLSLCIWFSSCPLHF
jgi:tripeptidyl-peptidase I